MAVNDEAVEAATFEEVFADKPEAEKSSDGAAVSGGVARDEQGRFSSKEEPAKAETAETPASEDEGGAIPPWRLRELREERDRVAARAETAERRATEYERQIAEYRRQQAEAAKPKQERPDSILDPDGYTNWVMQVWRENSAREKHEERLMRVDDTFDDAKEANPEGFAKAWGDLQKVPPGNPIFNQIISATNPGKALMRWHREYALAQEIGGDFNGYLKRKQDEWANDPEVRKRVLEAMDAEARGGNGAVTRSSNVTDLPSLNRATGSGGSRSDAGLGGSDSERFQNVYSRKR